MVDGPGKGWVEKMMKGSGGGDERKGWRDRKSLRINEVSRESCYTTGGCSVRDIREIAIRNANKLQQ